MTKKYLTYILKMLTVTVVYISFMYIVYVSFVYIVYVSFMYIVDVVICTLLT
jgi:hypothetical protein